MKGKKVLIVEDEPKLAALHKEYLEKDGFDAKIIESGEDAISLFEYSLRNDIEPFDIIILDVMLPGIDGIAVCKKLREVSNIPVIFVTARVEEMDRLLGLEVGADDYICKPFSPREVVARVKAVLKRYLSITDKTNEKLLNIDIKNRIVTSKEKTLDLTPCEFTLLAYLAEYPGRVYSRAQLLDALHDDYRELTDRAIDAHIKNIRKKISIYIDDIEVIQSVYGVGYKINAEVLK